MRFVLDLRGGLSPNHSNYEALKDGSINKSQILIFSHVYYLAHAARFGIPSHIEC